MALSQGTRLGSYEVLSPLGSGGMGEVYRARDTRLGREVAIKVLPADKLADPARRARFEQEARAVAALNHFHIVTIHEIEKEGDTDFIVMELVPGKPLDALIPRQGLRLGEALRIAIPLADALAAAHAAGVIHRDFKPGNVMVTPDGVVKVLDFGLAKLVRPDAVDSEEETAEARASPVTRPGTVAGTTGYMSPEQARGEGVDARTDVFAFGAVLYEMVTGRRAFAGSSIAETLAAVLKDQPKAPRELVPDVPRDLERIILRCLRKEPERRFQHMTDLKVELLEVKEESASQASAPAGVVTGPSRDSRHRWLPLLTAGALVVSSLAGLGIWWRFRAVPESPVIRSVIKVEPGYWLDGRRTISPWGFEQPTRTAMALSGDGRFLVYSAIRENPGPQAKPQLYLRRTDQLEARPIAGTEGGISPFLSPDDRWVGFWADGKLMKVPFAGGVPVTLCDAEMMFGASWGPEGTIVFSPSLGSGLLRVRADGGNSESLTTPDKTRQETSHRLPHWLADGKGLLFTIMREAYDLEPRVALLDLKTRTWRVLLDDAADARYVPTGHLVFLRRGTLMAVPFDAARRQPVGQPVPAVAGLVQTLNRLNPFENTAAGQLSVSDSGSLVYAAGGILPDIDSRLVWLDQRGNEQPAASVKACFFCPRLSPDGRRITYITGGMRFRVWVYDLDRGTASLLTSEGKVWNVTWTPDGKRVVFNWSKSGSGFSLYWQPADGSAPMERLTSSDHDQWLGSFSPDGTTLAFVEDRPDTGADILLLDLRSRRVTPFLSSKAREVDPNFSPDGRWLAYVSDESGSGEVYVRPFPDAGGKWQISSEGGSQPLWGRNGRRLFYRWRSPQRQQQAWAVDIATGGEFSVARPRLLFEGSGFQDGIPRVWDTSLDGQRFLMVKMEERKPAPLTEMVLVENWFEELRRLASTGSN
jgi:serine/threonine protein kinase/Tol biopolymer transport system component